MRQRTPQQKKIAAYVRDGRNAVAESRSIAHKAIAKRKAWINKSFRKNTKQTLSARIDLTEDKQLEAESSSLAIKKHRWRKYPDVPLIEFVEKQQNHHGKVDQLGKKDVLRAIAKRQVKKRYGI